MASQVLKVAALQLRFGADKAATLGRAKSLVRSAASSGAQLVCLPEAFTGLYGVDHFEGNAEEWRVGNGGSRLMSSLAQELDVHVCGGIIERHPISKLLYNTVAAFGPGGEEVARYRKLHLSCVSVGPDQTAEGDVLHAGEELSWFDVGDCRVGLACCFDLRFKEMAAMLVDRPPHGLGCDVLLYPSAFLQSTGAMGHWETLLTARALDGQCYVVGPNAAHVMDAETVMFGRTMIVGPMGETVAKCIDDAADEVVLGEVSVDDIREARRRIPLGKARRPLVYSDALYKAQQHPFAMTRPQKE